MNLLKWMSNLWHIKKIIKINSLINNNNNNNKIISKTNMDQPRNKALYNKIRIKINLNKINNKVFYLLKNLLMKLI